MHALKSALICRAWIIETSSICSTLVNACKGRQGARRLRVCVCMLITDIFANDLTMLVAQKMDGFYSTL